MDITFKTTGLFHLLLNSRVYFKELSLDLGLSVPELGAHKAKSGVDEPLPVVLILPLIWDLVGADNPISVVFVHQTSIEASHSLGDNPLEVVDHRVGHRVGGDVLRVIGGPKWNHVLPQRAVPCETTKPVWLMLLSSSVALNGDFHARVTEGSSHILVKVDVFCSKSLDQLLMVRREAGKGNGKEEEKERHDGRSAYNFLSPEDVREGSPDKAGQNIGGK